MKNKTNAELHALGWTWVKRSLSGELEAVTVDAEDAGDWMCQAGSHSVTRLRDGAALKETLG
jgi:hypothetical protein